MKHLHDYNCYLLENFDYQLLLEDSNFNSYRSIQDKTIKKWGLNLYFVGTFQMGITVLYPVVEALVKNSNIPNITKEQIVLMTVFSITQILNVFNNDIKKVHEELESKNLLDVALRVKNSLLSIFKIFKFVSRSFNKIVDVFTDMLGYVSLSVPVYMAIVELISKDGLNLDTLPQKAMIFGGGSAIFAFKGLIETIVAIVKNKIKR